MFICLRLVPFVLAMGAAAGPYDFGSIIASPIILGCAFHSDRRIVELSVTYPEARARCHESGKSLGVSNLCGSLEGQASFAAVTLEAHEWWLLRNREDNVLWTGQYARDIDPDSGAKLVEVGCQGASGGNLTVTWADDAGRSLSYYSASFLVRWLFHPAEEGFKSSASHRQPPPMSKSAWESMRKHDYGSVISSEEAALAFMEDVSIHGAALLHEAPLEKDVIENVTARMAFPGALHTLYGRRWSVRADVTDGPKNNVAYTSQSLELHQDLVYYESMPGIQMLHCIALDGVRGGESLLLDVMAAAEKLRLESPGAFQSLAEIPATFLKFDIDRAVPAHFEYRTPHIHVHPENGDVYKVVWAPPFEGPLQIRADRVEEYFRARAKFRSVMEGMHETHLLEFALQPGQVIAFNNMRMLHGRREFWKTQGGAGVRVLEGAYVGIDEFRNRLETTRRQVVGVGRPALESVYLGNRCA